MPIPLVKSLAVGRWTGDDDTKEPVLLAIAHDVSQFSWFARASVREGLTFASRGLIKRAQRGLRETVMHEGLGFNCHFFRQSDGLGAVLIADDAYPTAVAFRQIGEVLRAFAAAVPAGSWRTCTTDNAYLRSRRHPAGVDLAATLARAQEPEVCDRFTKVHHELAKTKAVLHRTIEAVLERDTKLEELMQKSDDLSAASKVFLENSRDTNRCCKMWVQRKHRRRAERAAAAKAEQQKRVAELRASGGKAAAVAGAAVAGAAGGPPKKSVSFWPGAGA